MSNNIFDPKNVFGGSSGGAVKYFNMGANGARSIQAWSLKRRLTKEGFDIHTVEAAATALKAGHNPEPIIQRALEDARARKQQAELKRSPPPIHGSARWSNPTELNNVGLTKSNIGHGLSFGTHKNSAVTWEGESHLLTVAPTRTGKGTMQIIPNLLQYKGSCVVLDPKGEMYEATSKWRRENVGPVYALNPFNMPITPPEGKIEQFTHAFNPLDTVTDNLSATKLAEMVFPRNDDDRSAFFDSEAIGFLSGVIEFFALYGTPEQRTMGNIRDKLSSISTELYQLLKAMTHPTMPNSIRNAAKNFYSKSKETGKPRVIDSLNQHLRTYVRMVLAMALNAMVEHKNKPDIPVLFVLDEFLTLDADKRFEEALRTHAFLQAEAQCFFGTNDIHTAKLISETMGNKTVAYEVPNTSASTSGGAGAAASYSISDNIVLQRYNLYRTPMTKPDIKLGENPIAPVILTLAISAAIGGAMAVGIATIIAMGAVIVSGPLGWIIFGPVVIATATTALPSSMKSIRFF